MVAEVQPAMAIELSYGNPAHRHPELIGEGSGGGGLVKHPEVRVESALGNILEGAGDRPSVDHPQFGEVGRGLLPLPPEIVMLPKRVVRQRTDAGIGIGRLFLYEGKLPVAHFGVAGRPERVQVSVAPDFVFLEFGEPNEGRHRSLVVLQDILRGAQRQGRLGRGITGELGGEIGSGFPHPVTGEQIVAVL